jgi:hypothetical protein
VNEHEALRRIQSQMRDLPQDERRRIFQTAARFRLASRSKEGRAALQLVFLELVVESALRKKL